MKLRIALALLCLAAVTAHAQTFRGGIQGIVTDASGAGVPGATVAATNVGTKLSRSAVADSTGNYTITELPPGEYTVVGSLQGFQSQTVKGVQVGVSSNQRVNMTLSVGDMKDTVEVTAALPLVDTTHNSQGGTIDGAQAAELPISGRDFTHLMSLVPGATSDPGQVSDSPGSFGYLSVNGNRGRANNYLLDGTDMNDGYRNDPAINEGGVFGAPATILPVDAIEEFPILSGVEAEYGRNAGAIVNMVTKSGTNELHGSVFEYFRNDSLSARNYFNSKANPKNPFKNHQFGASLGGPLAKDKTFFFLAYEGQRENVGSPTLTHVPSADELNASIAANGGAPNPVIGQLLSAGKLWPSPNRAADANGNNYESTTPSKNPVNSLIAKIDHHVSDADFLTARYFYGHSDQSFPLALVGGSNLPGFNTITPTTVNLGSVSYTHIFSPKLLMEVRGGYNRFWETFSPEDGSFDPNSVGLNTGVTNPRDFGLPEIVVSGFASLGANRANPRGRTDQNYQAFTNFSYNTGRHNWKFGYEFRRTTVSQYFDEGFRGKLKFASLDDFIAGRISNGGRSVRGDSNADTFENSHGFYAQDSFQVSRSVTLNYGLRWDYYGVIGEKNNRFSIFDPATQTVNRVTQLYPKDWNNFSPRASVAWDTKGDGKTVVRAGGGLYYDAFSQDFFLGQLPWNTFSPGVAYNDMEFSYSAADSITSGAPVFPSDGFSASVPTLHGFPDVWTVKQDLQTPWVANYSANVQQLIGKHAAIQAGYVGSIGRHLFRYVDINQLNPATGAAPFPNYEYINRFESTAESHYNSLQVSLKLRDWHGLTSTMNYTLSKSVDTASDGQDYVQNAAQPDDSTHPERESGPSNFDNRHRFTWYFTWDAGPRKGNWLTSGWSFDGIFTFSSGQPFNVNNQYWGDFNGTGEYTARPDQVGDPSAGTGGPDKFLNLSAFQVPCNYDGNYGCNGGQHFGNLTRNAFYGPHFTNMDFSIVKNTPLGSRARLQVRVDIFNIFNHPNFANPLLPNFYVDFAQNDIDPATGRGQGFLPLTATADVGTGNPFLGGGAPRSFQIAARISF
jgi:outer membrane receptor protein involved in Fe transport